MALQLTIDNAQLTIQKIMIFQFSILNFQLKQLSIVSKFADDCGAAA